MPQPAGQSGVLCEIYEDGALNDFRYFTPEQDELAVRILFNLLEEFFASISDGPIA
jgi:hypothetical protein